jgi:lysyl-tRNA synthetase class I
MRNSPPGCCGAGLPPARQKPRAAAYGQLDFERQQVSKLVAENEELKRQLAQVRLIHADETYIPILPACPPKAGKRAKSWEQPLNDARSRRPT